MAEEINDGVYNFPNQKEGDTFKAREFQVLINDVPKDLTDYKIRIEFRKQKQTGEVVKVLTDDDGIEKFDAVNGWFRIKKFKANTLPVGTIYYDVELTHQTDADDVITYFGGTVLVTQTTTQPPVA